MDHPDWYPSWRREAFHLLQEKNARLKTEFRLGEWSRFDYDVDAGVLVFSDDRKPRVVADIQVVGTTSLKTGDWLWAWANSHWPESRTADAKAVRDFGERHGVRELVRESLADENLNALGWGLTAVAARVTDALGAYRPPRNEAGDCICSTGAWVGRAERAPPDCETGPPRPAAATAKA